MVDPNERRLDELRDDERCIETFHASNSTASFNVME